jgi:5-methylcytosine-specific restriction endonuclease McrA
MPRTLYNWTEIQIYHDEGHGFVKCRERFGLTHTAWNKAIATGRLRTKRTPFRDRRRKYDWAEIQAYYDEGNSYRQCAERFGFASLSWHKARQRGEIKPRAQGMPLEQLLTGRRDRSHVKSRLLRAGIIENRCSECGLCEWRGKPISIHIDHINGIRGDHRLENLRMLCPNCHSQTETYGGKNRRSSVLHDKPRTV